MLVDVIGHINAYLLHATMLNSWHITCHLIGCGQCSSEFGFATTVGSGLICETRALQAAVIPAKAGIHSANLRKRAVHGLDSRPSASSGQAFRGNDRRFVWDDISNETTTADLVATRNKRSAAVF